LKTAIYARCSTKKQDLDSQIAKLKEWVCKHNHDYILYQDFAVSGRKASRAGITALMESARNKEFELVGILELSRIGRSIKFIWQTIEELSKLNIKVVLTNNNTTLDYNSLEGRALIGGLALASDIEWMLIQERNARGREKIKQQNIKVGAKRKPISMQAIEALRQKGLSLRQIANEMGVSAPTIMRRFRNAHKCNVTESKHQNNSDQKEPIESETVLQQ